MKFDTTIIVTLVFLFSFFINFVISSSSSSEKVDTSSCIAQSSASCNSTTYNTTCHWCDPWNTCMPLEYECNKCWKLKPAECNAVNQNKSNPEPFFHPQSCTWCPNQEICTDNSFDPRGDPCFCGYFDPETCDATPKCKNCPGFMNCYPNNSWESGVWYGTMNCECWNFSSAPEEKFNCEYATGGLCTACGTSMNSLCVEDRFKNDELSCQCDVLNQSECISNQGLNCIWCENLNTCTVAENKDCSCYYFATEEKCKSLRVVDGNSTACQWCAESLPDHWYNSSSASAPYPMNYCMKPEDICKCSYLPNDFCGENKTAPGHTVHQFSDNCQKCDIQFDLDNNIHEERNVSFCIYTGGAFGPNGTSHGEAISTTTTTTTSTTTTTTTTFPNSTFPTTSETNISTTSTPVPYAPPNLNNWCSCYNFEDDEYTCNKASPACSWNSPVLTLPQAAPYCTPYQSCSPLSCQSITDQDTCKAAQCFWDGNFCDNGECFRFFISGFLPQPFILFAAGCLKDCIVLFMIGVLGDYIGRVVKYAISTTRKCLGIQKKYSNLPVDMNTTVYISDKVCRDDVDFSFQDYCAKLRDQLIEKMNSNNNGGDDSNSNNNVRTNIKSITAYDEMTLRDCVAYSLFNNGLWIPDVLEKKQKEKRSNNNNQHHYEESTPLIKSQHGSTINNEDDLYSDHGNEDQKPLVDEAAVVLQPSDFSSIVKLQSKVDSILFQRASCIVFYTQSRSMSVSAASAINSFPSALQCVYYCGSVILLFGVSLHVVSQDPNLAKVAAGCQAGSTTSNTNAPVTSAPDQQTLYNDNALRIAAYFLLGFRLLNASTFGTATLVLVKTIRGLYQKFRGLGSLTLQQRLPLMALYSDRKIHFMLFVYFALVLPFSLCGPTYGLGWISRVCSYPFLIGLGVLIVDAIILLAFRTFNCCSINNSHTHQYDHRIDGNDDNDERDGVVYRKQNDDASFSSASELKSNLNNTKCITNGNDDNEDEEEDDGKKKEEENATATTLANLFSVDHHLKREQEEEEEEEEATKDLERSVRQKQTSINSAAPVTIGRALLVFLLTEEIPTICLAAALQTSFNYTALLHFESEFALSDDHYQVIARDYKSRSVHCIVEFFEHDLSAKLSDLSSFFPFM